MKDILHSPQNKLFNDFFSTFSKYDEEDEKDGDGKRGELEEKFEYQIQLLKEQHERQKNELKKEHLDKIEQFEQFKKQRISQFRKQVLQQQERFESFIQTTNQMQLGNEELNQIEQIQTAPHLLNFTNQIQKLKELQQDLQQLGNQQQQNIQISKLNIEQYHKTRLLELMNELQQLKDHIENKQQQQLKYIIEQQQNQLLLLQKNQKNQLQQQQKQTGILNLNPSPPPPTPTPPPAQPQLPPPTIIPISTNNNNSSNNIGIIVIDNIKNSNNSQPHQAPIIIDSPPQQPQQQQQQISTNNSLTQFQSIDNESYDIFNNIIDEDFNDIEEYNTNLTINSTSSCKLQGCIVCIKGRPPSFTSGKQSKWRHFLYLTLYSLNKWVDDKNDGSYPYHPFLTTVNYPDKRFFHISECIFKFIVDHWNIIYSKPVPKQVTYSIYNALNSNTKYFLKSSRAHWGLVRKDIDPYSLDFYQLLKA